MTVIVHVTVEPTLFVYLWFYGCCDRPEPEGDDSAERSSGKARVRDASRACKKKLFSKPQPSSSNILQLYIKCVFCISPLHFAALYFLSCNRALPSELIGPKLN